MIPAQLGSQVTIFVSSKKNQYFRQDMIFYNEWSHPWAWIVIFYGNKKVKEKGQVNLIILTQLFFQNDSSSGMNLKKKINYDMFDTFSKNKSLLYLKYISLSCKTKQMVYKNTSCLKLYLFIKDCLTKKKCYEVIIIEFHVSFFHI